MPPEPLSVSEWLQQLQTGDHAAAEELWQRYCRRLVDMARRLIRGLPSRVADDLAAVVDPERHAEIDRRWTRGLGALLA